MEILWGRCVGRVDPADLKTIPINTNDPYKNDPLDRWQGFKFHSKKPCNAEPPESLLTQEWITPASIHYIRSHHPVPVVTNPENFTLKVDVGEGKIHSFCLNDLKTKFPKTEIVATLQCSGNRRSNMNKVRNTSGSSWGQGAISTSKWGGVKIRDLLRSLGVDEDSAERSNHKHIRLFGLDAMCASIDVAKGLGHGGDAILAYEMNGGEIPRDHGFPLRAIAPGYVGVRNVKWVEKLQVSGGGVNIATRTY